MRAYTTPKPRQILLPLVVRVGRRPRRPEVSLIWPVDRLIEVVVERVVGEGGEPIGIIYVVGGFDECAGPGGGRTPASQPGSSTTTEAACGLYRKQSGGVGATVALGEPSRSTAKPRGRPRLPLAGALTFSATTV